MVRSKPFGWSRLRSLDRRHWNLPNVLRMSKDVPRAGVDNLETPDGEEAATSVASSAFPTSWRKQGPIEGDPHGLNVEFEDEVVSSHSCLQLSLEEPGGEVDISGRKYGCHGCTNTFGDIPPWLTQ